jgi:hypothetical protein
VKDERRIDLRALFGDLQTELQVRLGTARRNLQHPGAKGSVTESEWMSLLAAYLPRRYAVDKGFVVDSHGRISDEIDIIVHDRHFSPLLFHHAHTCYVPAESVYAVFEVKPELSLANVQYAGTKAASVRGLHRTSASIQHAGGHFEPRTPPKVLAGLLTSGSGWSPPDSGLAAALGTLESERRLDLGCSARDVAFKATYDSGSLALERCMAGEELVFFLLHLLRSLQSAGSVPAINYEDYLEALRKGRADGK